MNSTRRSGFDLTHTFLFEGDNKHSAEFRDQSGSRRGGARYSVVPVGDYDKRPLAAQIAKFADNVTAFGTCLIIRYLASKDMSYQAPRNSDKVPWHRVFMDAAAF